MKVPKGSHRPTPEEIDKLKKKVNKEYWETLGLFPVALLFFICIRIFRLLRIKNETGTTR